MNETFVQHFTDVLISLKCLIRLLNYSSKSVYDNDAEIDVKMIIFSPFF
jgi:hypothetical protein